MLLLKIEYIYDANGVKQKKIVSTGNTTLYAGNYIYENDQLQFFNHSEGYVHQDGSGNYSYVYQYKDHLGNVRLSYSDADLNGAIDPNTEIIEENNYYPFGLKHKGYNAGVSSIGNSTAQKFKFGGKELSQELGLETYDFGARNYDPALGRWMNLDPLAEQMRRHSPYNYAFNNPMRFIDPDGMAPNDIVIGENNRAVIFASLQELSTDELQMDESGKVTIKNENLDNFDKLYGTNLVRDLIGSESVVSIISGELNKTSTPANAIIEGQIVETEKGKIVGTGKGQKKVKVEFNPNDKNGGVNEIVGGRKRPVSIGLGHELIHAQTNISGKNDRSPNKKGLKSFSKRKVLTQDEYDTRVKENILREEHNGVPLRKIGRQ